MTPIHKGNNKTNKNNYRPISVLPVLSKIFERHLHKSLYVFLNVNDLLYQLQSAFRKYGSTKTVLIIIFDRMRFNLYDNRINSLALADFQKVLDLVSYDILIYGLHECSLGLIRSFLHNRRQRTVICGSVQSSSQTLRHGVPQGSVLSPLLFLVFINGNSKGNVATNHS